MLTALVGRDWHKIALTTELNPIPNSCILPPVLNPTLTTKHYNRLLHSRLLKQNKRENTLVCVVRKPLHWCSQEV